jgi:hypothetical protein
VRPVFSMLAMVCATRVNAGQRRPFAEVAE